ncbi:MAG: ABC transporter permease [Candidatus Rokubacteria bacterium]|nr:ABC transporter permease [Candidatus Rokubacteria bacterium]
MTEPILSRLRAKAGGDATLYAYGVLLYLFLYAPIVYLIIFSFNDATATTPPWRGFTLQWYRQVLQNVDLRVAFLNSASLGVMTAVISVTLGTLMAFAFRWRFRGKGFVFGLLLLPMLTPGIVLGVALTLLWRFFRLTPGLFSSTLVAHVIYTLPFAFLIVFTRLHRFDRSLEEAAMDLGADHIRTFRHVTFPLIRPGVIAAVIFAFTLSFDEFIRTFFVIGNENTLPMYVWSMIMTDSTPQTNAIGAIIVGLSLSWILLGTVFLRR